MRNRKVKTHWGIKTDSRCQTIGLIDVIQCEPFPYGHVMLILEGSHLMLVEYDKLCHNNQDETALKLGTYVQVS